VVNVTERAKDVLRKKLIACGAGPEEGLRLYPRSNGSFVLSIDTELSGDQVVKHCGYKVLLIGVKYLRMLDGATVDCRDEEDGHILFVEIDRTGKNYGWR